MPRPQSPQGSLEAIYDSAVSQLIFADKWLGEIPALSRLAESFNVKPVYIPVALVAISLLFFGKMEELILGTVGFFYPAWCSFKAMEANEADQSRQWLSYWVVYASFSFVEIFSDSLLFWIPFYYFCKLVFLLWLFLPHYQGATIVYQSVLRPLLLLYGGRIDRMIGSVTKHGQGVSRLQECEDVTEGGRRRR